MVDSAGLSRAQPGKKPFFAAHESDFFHPSPKLPKCLRCNTVVALFQLFSSFSSPLERVGCDHTMSRFADSSKWTLWQWRRLQKTGASGPGRFIVAQHTCVPGERICGRRRRLCLMTKATTMMARKATLLLSDVALWKENFEIRCCSHRFALVIVELVVSTRTTFGDIYFFCLAGRRLLSPGRF